MNSVMSLDSVKVGGASYAVARCFWNHAPCSGRSLLARAAASSSKRTIVNALP